MCQIKSDFSTEEGKGRKEPDNGFRQSSEASALRSLRSSVNNLPDSQWKPHPFSIDHFPLKTLLGFRLTELAQVAVVARLRAALGIRNLKSGDISY